MKKTLHLLAFFTTIVSNAQNLISQNFDDITALEPSGWIFSNQANNLGSTTWFQGTDTVFAANSGATTSYIGANFNSITGSGRISTWLFTPMLTGLQNGDIISFYTRTTTNPAIYPDRLELRISSDATEVLPNAPNNVGSFTTLALSVNPTMNTTDYPAVWTQYSYTITGLSGPTDSRIALRYHVQQGGPSGTNSNYIGIDDFSVDRPALDTRDFFTNNFSLQPNPVKDIFNVIAKNNSTIDTVSVIDINGRIVSKTKFSGLNSVDIDVANLNAGVYFVKIISEKGIGTTKIVKD